MEHERDDPLSVSVGEERLLADYLQCPVSERRRRFLDTLSAAQLTGLSRRTIQWWVECGLVAAVMIGRRYQIEKGSLLSHLERFAQGLE
ncbi:MAG: helix-turn-helix domain-containing protein [Acidobacteriota bacterium]